MTIVERLILYIIILIVGAVLYYALFPRQFKNMIVSIIRYKSYINVIIRKQNTMFQNQYKVVPESDFWTTINGRKYFLHPDQSICIWAGRLLFVCDEENGIPISGRKEEKENIIFFAKEINNAMNNDVAEYLFSRKKDILTIIIIIIIIITIVALWYDVSVISKNNQLIAEYIQNSQAVKI